MGPENRLLLALRGSPTALLAAVVLLGFLVAAVAPGLIAPYHVTDLATLDIADAFLPPAWLQGGTARYLLGTDDQGRDVLSAILYGARVSLLVSVAAVLLAATAGVALGLVAGYFGGWVDALVMRVADVQLTFPAILIAVLMDGAARAAFGQVAHDRLAAPLLVAAIALSGWVQYARTVRAATMVQKRLDYVLAAQVIGRPSSFILRRHIAPNVMTPVLVLGTIHLAVAIILEATLSFVGLGLPPTDPSLGTLVRIGNGFLLSGEWWIAVFPGCALLVLVLAINLLGDRLQDAFNPRLGP